MSDILSPGLHKLHKAYLVFFTLNGLRFGVIPIAVIIAALFRDNGDFLNSTGIPLPILFAMLIIIIIAVIFCLGIISYVRYKWELTENEVRIYKGIIFRKKIRLPFTRINTIDSNARLVERIFGLVSMRFDTAGGSSNKADAMIPMLQLDEAEALKAEIFRRKDMAVHNVSDVAEKQPQQYDVMQSIGMAAEDIRGVFAGSDRDNVSVEYEYRLSGREILFTSIANSHVFISILILFGFVSGLYGVANDFADVANVDINNVIGGYVEKNIGAPGDINSTLTIVLIILIPLLIIGYIFAIISKFISFGGFAIQKRGDRIEVGRGLLARKTSSIVTHRVQTVSLRQGLIMRMLGYAEVRAETASALSAQKNEKNASIEDSVIHPFIKLSKLDDFIAGVIPEFTGRPENFETLTLKALRRSITRYGLWSLIILVLPAVATSFFVPVPEYVFVGVAVLWVLCVLTGMLKWRGRAISRTSGMIAMRSGALQRKFIFVPRHKIQYATKKVNPFQRMAKMATFSIYTAAMHDKHNGIKDLTSDKSDEFLEWVEPRK